jgi:hypothetical protein
MGGLRGTLPGGYWDPDGTLHREFELVELTGREEELLAESGRRESASLVSVVLSRCVRSIGRVSPVPEDVARRLLVADRLYLLLQLRRATFGDRVHADLFCPWPDCGERVSLAFSIDAIPVEEPAERAPAYTMWLSGEAGGGEVEFRLPTGGDQEELSPWLAHDEAQALMRLLARCVRRPSGVDALSPLARAEIEARMAEVAPRIEQTVEARCAGCGRSFSAPLDIHRFFFGELRADPDLLYREVHYLAYHYHWSEAEIMAMTRDRRRRYMDVLAGEIERLNDAG